MHVHSIVHASIHSGHGVKSVGTDHLHVRGRCVVSMAAHGAIAMPLKISTHARIADPDSLGIPHWRGIFPAMVRASRRIWRRSRGAGIAHHACGWCVMRMRPGLAGIGLLVLATSCAPMPPIALTATPADLEILAGQWAGEYESAALGRRGRIEFTLKAGTNEARGDVLMVPRGSGTPYQSRPSHDALPPPTTPSFDLLTIRFIRASNGSSSGGWIAIGIRTGLALRTPHSTDMWAAALWKAHSRRRLSAAPATPRERGTPARSLRTRRGKEIVMSETRDHKVALRLVRGYEFVATFRDSEGLPPIVFDEPAPLGEGSGPNAAAVLAAAIGNCLAASFAFCLRKAGSSR